MPIRDIQYLDVENFLAGFDCGPKRINNLLIPMRSVFKMAYKHGYVDENVMVKVDNIPVSLPETFPCSQEEKFLICQKKVAAR